MEKKADQKIRNTNQTEQTLNAPNQPNQTRRQTHNSNQEPNYKRKHAAIEEMDPAKLQKQLAKLMSAVLEERALFKEVETAQQQAEALLAKHQLDPQPKVVATAQERPKISVLEKFNGTKGLKAEVYAGQIGLYVI